MNHNTAIAALGIAAVAAIVIWNAVRTRQPNAAANLSFVPVSNSPALDGNDWSTPWYLRYNYPAVRGNVYPLPTLTENEPGDGNQLTERMPQL